MTASPLRIAVAAPNSPAAVAIVGAGVVWTEPDMVAEIEFRGWIGDGKLRQASYEILCERADAADVFAFGSG